ncbi:MAG: aldo/keto reductase [Polyangiaceae bacterium]|nr:aldo/keto reductase [Polyangiaceae bacterium]
MNDIDTTKRITSVSDYSLLGRSGLRVSPLCLGTMTFGTEWGWGSPKETVHRLLDRFIDAGGNFIDTADGYTGGTSETMIGDYLAERKRRDEVVLATKFTFNTRLGDPNAGGNGRKNVMRAVESSLKRLKTDYIDLYWLHAWDGMTPVEEVMSTFDALVRSGKVRYIGLSDVPAWYASRGQTIAELRGMERIAALQLEYSLLERNIEREHIPLAIELGMGVTPWSPLASGLLSGKYKREAANAAGGAGRLSEVQKQGNPAFLKLLTERNWKIVDELVAVAKQLGRSPAQVALAWVTRRPGVASTIIGATKLEQLEDNLRALETDLPRELVDRLETVSRPETIHPYIFFEPTMRAMVTGGTSVRAEPRGYRPL